MSQADYDKLLASAKITAEQLRVGQTFVVKNLFLGTEWAALDAGDKRSFGRFFKRKVSLGQIPNISVFGEAKNHSTVYVKG